MFELMAEIEAMRPARFAYAWLASAALFTCASISRGSEGSPALQFSEPPAVAAPTEIRGDGVTAIVVRSWGFHSEELVWNHLNSHWQQYGSVPLTIDYVSMHGVNRVELQDLEATGADVVIVSNPAGGTRQWLEEEVEALEMYARQGHSLVGTYRLFHWKEIDNRLLAPLWGLRSDLEFVSEEIEASPFATLLNPLDCAFAGISDPMEGGGFRFVELPQDDLSWDPEDLNGATFLARSESGRNIVTRYEADSYRSFYVSYMPEWQDGTDAQATQWLYNVIVCAAQPVSVEPLSWAGIKARYRK